MSLHVPEMAQTVGMIGEKQPQTLKKLHVTPEPPCRRAASAHAGWACAALLLGLGACARHVGPAQAFEGKKAHALDAERLAQLEAFIEHGRREAKIPGLAVAVIQGGRVVFARGFGVKALGSTDPVTPDTLFRIASITKPLTSLMVARLVSEGRISWDTHVSELAPELRLADGELTRKLTLRDLLCACTGIPDDNLGTPFEYADVSAEKLLERMRWLSPTADAGTTIQESNPMVAAAGYLAAHALVRDEPLGQAYVHAMQAEVFGPLGMTATTFDARAVARSDYASPHLRENAAFEPERSTADPAEWVTPLNPAIGAWSTASDLAKVLELELAGGKARGGDQLLAERELMARREPQVPDRAGTSYGLGLYVERVDGVRVDGTAGHAPGFSSTLFFLPDHGVAAVMLTNVDPPNPLTWAFRRRLLELLFDGPDGSKEALARDVQRLEARHAQEISQIDLTPGRAFFERFTGTWVSPLHGEITIRLDGNGAVLDAGEWKTTVGRQRAADDTELLVGAPPPWLGWPALSRHERSGKVTLELRERNRTVVFERKGPPAP